MHTLVSDLLEVQILTKGAEICSIKNKAGTEFMWQAKPDVWPRHAPVLFPIVGKLNNNTYTFSNKPYELSQHGFARDLDFKLIDAGTSSCTYELSSSAETRLNFPFGFVFRIKYELTGSELTTRYSVKNPSSSTLLFSLGAHPGFSCPLAPGESFEDYYLEFEKDVFCTTALQNGLRTQTKKELVLTNKKLSLSPHLFDNDALVFENSQVNSVSLCSTTSSHKIKLKCKDWPYFGIWSKKGCREFICLEPWYGIADRTEPNGELATKDGIITLQPGAEFKCFFTLQFH